MNAIAFCAPFALILLCALVLILEDRREERLHRRMARDLARPRVGIDRDPRHDFGVPPSAEWPWPARRERVASAPERTSEGRDSCAHDLDQQESRR